MDRSFLGFKQLLLRIINGPEHPKPTVEPATRTPDKPEAVLRDDWARVEL